MQLDLNEMRFIIGDKELLENMENIPAFQPFDTTIINYLDAVSKLLLSNPEAKQYSDVITFAFWCRKASIMNLQKEYHNDMNRIGRGVVFHIAPSNVAVNFAYSLVVGMLSGNANIVRLPSKEFDQVGIICKALIDALTDEMKPYICLLQYGHSQVISDYLSSICDSRIIWGGDQTIKTIRKSPIKSRAIDISFADRYSICVINSNEYLVADDKEKIAIGFYNDTYLSDQNACTSPRIVIWMGTNIEEAQEIFWEELYKVVVKKYNLQPVQAVAKFTSLCKYASVNNSISVTDYKNNYIYRIKLDNLDKNVMENKGNSGYFFEYSANKIDDILPLCTLQCQTLTYYGIDVNELREFILLSRPRGIDRFVPIGKAMDFSLIWDGYDLISSLTRKINIDIKR